MTHDGRSRLVAAGFAVCIAVAPLSAQIAIDVPLPVGLPTLWEGPAVTHEDAIAVAGGGAIHSWSNLLSGAPTHSVVSGIGWETMHGRWYPIADKAAVFRALGNDGLPDTSDDPLMLVTQLPNNPTLINTGLTGLSADFDEVTQGTALQVSGASFLLLRTNPGGVVLDVESTQRPMIDDAVFSAGRVGPDAYAALDPGFDGLAGTPDDVVTVISDVDNQPTVTSYAVPAGASIRGMRTLESGHVVVWWDVGLPTIRLASLDVSSGSWHTLDVTPPASPSPWFTPAFGVTAVQPATVKVSCTDDLGPGEGHALVTRVGASPLVVGSWYDDWNGAQSHDVISATEVITYSALNTTGYVYTDHATAVSHFVAQPWSDRLTFEKPATPTLVAFSDQPAWMTGTTNEARTVVFAEANQSGSEQDLIGVGRWGGGGYDAQGNYWEPRIETLAPGVVAGFLGDTFGALHTLRVVTVPSASVVGEATGAGAGLAQLSVPGGVPGSTGTTLSLRVDAPATWASMCTLYVSMGLLEHPVVLPTPMFAQDSLLHLDLGQLSFVWPMTLTNGSGTVTFQVAAALQLFAGQPFYMQGAVEDGSAQLNVTSAMQIVIN